MAATKNVQIAFPSDAGQCIGGYLVLDCYQSGQRIVALCLPSELVNKLTVVNVASGSFNGDSKTLTYDDDESLTIS